MVMVTCELDNQCMLVTTDETAQPQMDDASQIGKTIQLSYRKDDRVMRPIYGCPGIFRES